MGGLFRLAAVTLHSGKVSDWKIDCDALDDEDMRCVAALLVRQLPRFGSVEGVPKGGLRLADAIRPFQTTGPLLIVDDVLTTGGSMEAQRNGRDAIGAVIFSRAMMIVTPGWITSLVRVVHPSLVG